MENNGSNLIPNHDQPPPPPYSQQLQNFWFNEIESNTDFKAHPFPKTRVKRIMKSDPDVQMVTAEAPIMLAKACEMFIVDLTMRSWFHAQENKRNTLQKSDISAAVAEARTSSPFDFLQDVVQRDESVTVVDDPDSGGVPEYPPGMVVGTPVVDMSGMFPPPQ